MLTLAQKKRDVNKKKQQNFKSLLNLPDGNFDAHFDQFKRIVL
jgi:hypothetical protein